MASPPPCAPLEKLAKTFVARYPNARERAIAVHDCVREVPFGFTWRFDGASALYTLERNRGHCTPKSELFAQLLRRTAKVVGVQIDNQILRGFGNFPEILHHTFVEVTVEGGKCRLDSFIIDSTLFEAAKEKLEEEGRELGYGIHSKGTFEWDGKSNAFSQYFDSKSMAKSKEVHTKTTAELVGHDTYAHKDLAFLRSIPLLGWGMGCALLETKNSVIEKLRRQKIEGKDLS